MSSFTYFHATNLDSARSIWKTGRLEPGENGLDGPGIYVTQRPNDAERRARCTVSVVFRVHTYSRAKQISGGAGNFVIHDPNLIRSVQIFKDCSGGQVYEDSDSEDSDSEDSDSRRGNTYNSEWDSDDSRY